MTGASLYMLDTNIVSHMMREPLGVASQRVLDANASMQASRVCTSVIVLCELQFGLRRRTHARWATHYQRVMADLEVAPLTSSVAKHYAELRTHLESAGLSIGSNDTLIAAHALALDAVLVSADLAFRHVPALKLENWLA